MMKRKLRKSPPPLHHPTRLINGQPMSPTRKNMYADHIIKYHTDHPMSKPKVVGVKLTGGVSGPQADSILKGVYLMRYLTGQMPSIIKAKNSVAGFNIRKGADLLVSVTVRKEKKIKDYIIMTMQQYESSRHSLPANGPRRQTAHGDLLPLHPRGRCPLGPRREAWLPPVTDTSIKFGLSAPAFNTQLPQLPPIVRGYSAGLNVEILKKGSWSGSRGKYLKSQLLLL